MNNIADPSVLPRPARDNTPRYIFSTWISGAFGMAMYCGYLAWNDARYNNLATTEPVLDYLTAVIKCLGLSFFLLFVPFMIAALILGATNKPEAPKTAWQIGALSVLIYATSMLLSLPITAIFSMFAFGWYFFFPPSALFLLLLSGFLGVGVGPFLVDLIWKPDPVADSPV